MSILPQKPVKQQKAWKYWQSLYLETAFKRKHGDCQVAIAENRSHESITQNPVSVINGSLVTVDFHSARR